MTGDEVRHGFEAMWPPEEIDRLCAQFGVIKRERKLKLGMFVRALVISAGTPGGAYQADVLRSYLACEGPPVARSACSRWVDAPLERFLAALADPGPWPTPGRSRLLGGVPCAGSPTGTSSRPRR
jgi:hypothetical protein